MESLMSINIKMNQNKADQFGIYSILSEEKRVQQMYTASTNNNQQQ